MNRAILLLGYGNPGRGDDALGPELVKRIEKLNIPDIVCQSDMQLQVEHVTDLQHCIAVIFVDADASCATPFHFSGISAERDESYTSHAMTPQALLHAYRQVFKQDAAPAFLLRIRGHDFKLGDPLSARAEDHLDAATRWVQQLCLNPSIEQWSKQKL